MRRRRNSWLFEGKDGAADEEIEFDDAGFEEGGDTIEVDAAALEDALGLDAGTISGGGDEDLDDDLDMEDDEDLDMDDDLDMDEDLGDETYESMQEADEKDEDECSEDDEVVEVNESMLRRALGASRRRRTPARRTSARRRSSRRLSEARRRRIAAARRRRRLHEGDARKGASAFGGGKLGSEMFVDVDENTLLNALAEELGGHGNGTAAQGSASKMAGHFGGGSVKSGVVMEARKHRRTKRALNETKRIANRNARAAKAAKAELKESNLFNAKLLMVTRLLQSHSLNNKQQRAIIEAMDNAKTQREAKLLFTSLNESLNKRKLNESRKAASRSTLNESRNAYSNTSKRSGQAPRGNAIELDRWAVLAGIKK